MKTGLWTLGCLGVAAVAGLAWMGGAGRWPGLNPAARQAEAGPLRKCVAADGRITYLQGDCPSGQRAQAVREGTVNVVAAPPAPASGGGSAVPALRTLAGSEQEIAAMRRKAQEKAAGL